VTTVWILTEEYNEYDQYGQYFVAVFAKKPNHLQLLALGVSNNRLRHILNGGGRKEDEQHWYILKEMECK